MSDPEWLSNWKRDPSKFDNPAPGQGWQPGQSGYPAGRPKGIVDHAMLAHGLERDAVATVSGFSTAIALARSTDLVATVPERHTAGLRAGMHTFRLPFAMDEITVSLLWHPRMDADPGHRWMRACVREICSARA